MVESIKGSYQAALSHSLWFWTESQGRRNRHSSSYRQTHPAHIWTHTVDGEKLRAMLLINPTKSTLLPILNQGEVGQNPRQTYCIWFNRQPILLQSSPIKLPASHLALNHLNQT